MVSEFGKQIQNEDGTLNRAALGEIIFNDQKKRDVVNGLLHPLIKEEMLNQVKVAEEKAVDLVVLDIPLLFESKCEQYCDAVLVVDVSPETQKGRLMRRNDFTQKEAQARIDSQMDPADRKKRADFVVNNDASEEKTYQQVDILLEDILN